MPRDARFWRNVAIIAVAHVAIIVMFVRWNREVRRPNLQSIVWMSGGGTEVAAQNASAETETAIENPPPSETRHSEAKEQDEPPPAPPARSDLQLPTPSPSTVPIPTPPPKQIITPLAKASPRPTPKATRNKPVLARIPPKPSPKKKAPAQQEGKSDEHRREAAKTGPSNANGSDGERSGVSGPNGAIRESEFGWYGKMLHDRFYSEWIQPTTSVSVGAKISALVRIRIEKDGRITNFTIVRPSGNVVVDESVAAVAKQVTQVDPLPKGLGNGAYYEVNINFELNPEQ